MNESELPTAETVPASPVIKHRRSRRWWPWLLLIAAGGIGYGGYQHQQLEASRRSGSEWQQLADELRGRQLEVDRALDGVRERQRIIDTRLTESATSQRVLREEVLAFGERAALLETALTRLAESRQEGAQAMLLDEAEFLLLTGAERLGLFADVGAAVRAFQLADRALASLRDPLYAGVRQSLAQEIATLQALPPDPLAQAKVELNHLLADLPTLPPSERVERADGHRESRLMDMLSGLVTVRRLDDAGVPLDPLLRAARVQALTLQLRLALAQLERGEVAAWRDATPAVIGEIKQLFAPAEPRVEAHLTALAAHAALQPQRVPEVGMSLTELRLQRASTRASTPATGIEQAAAAPPEVVESTPADAPVEAPIEAAEPPGVDAVEIE